MQKWHGEGGWGGLQKWLTGFWSKNTKISASTILMKYIYLAVLNLKFITHEQAAHVHMIFTLCTIIFFFTVCTWFYSLNFWEKNIWKNKSKAQFHMVKKNHAHIVKIMHIWVFLGTILVFERQKNMAISTLLAPILLRGCIHFTHLLISNGTE